LLSVELRGYGRTMKTIVKIALGMVLGATILIVGCAALLGAGANKAIHDIRKSNDAHGITTAQYHSIKLGEKHSEVEAALVVSPVSRDDTQIANYNSSCSYYTQRGHVLGDFFQFCFHNNRVESKASI
jgi:hypothetical protein